MPEDSGGDVIDTTISKPLRGWRRRISDWIHGRIGLWTLTYDDSIDAYSLDYDTIPRDQIPKSAVHVTGEGDKCYFLDKAQSGAPPGPMHGNATDLYCWYKNSDLDDSIVSAQKSVPLSRRTLIYAAVAAVALVLLFVFYM